MIIIINNINWISNSNELPSSFEIEVEDPDPRCISATIGSIYDSDYLDCDYSIKLE